MNIDSGKTNKNFTILINENENAPVNLDDQMDNQDSKFKILFQRYLKLYLVKVKSIKPPKNLRLKDYQEIVKYI